MEGYLMLFLYGYMFVLGASVASFLNVVSYRWPRDIDFVHGRSECPHCHHTLSFLDMIPVLGWFLLRGRCRYCKTTISFRYPLVELIGGLLGVLCFYRYGIGWMTLISFSWAMVLLLIALIDLDTMTIPNGCIGIALFVGLFTIPFVDLALVNRILGIFAVSVPLCLINLWIKDSFGGGDIKLLAVCGFILGWLNGLLALFIGIIIAGTYAFYLIVSKKIERKSHIAFGPYLCFGIFIALLYGNQIVEWYLSLFGL